MAPKHTSRKTVSVDPEPLSRKDVDDLKNLLVQKRDELTGQIAKLKNDAVDGSDSTNWEEDGTDAFDREFAFKMAGSRNEMLNEIDEALRKIDENVYGICEGCNGKISRARIKVLPFCKSCIECQSKSELGRGHNRVRVPK